MDLHSWSHVFLGIASEKDEDGGGWLFGGPWEKANRWIRRRGGEVGLLVALSALNGRWPYGDCYIGDPSSRTLGKGGGKEKG